MRPTSKHLGLAEYEPTWRAMQAWAAEEADDNSDQLWILQHPPVFTMGQNADPVHLLNPGNIPVIDIDRGGQVTYHGPGQLVIYPLLTLENYGVGVRSLVKLLENTMIQTLADYGITAAVKDGAPGVYVNDSKIGSIGLRIKNGRCYHGLALNVDMDLGPFSLVNPCGFEHLQMTQVSELANRAVSFDEVSSTLEQQLLENLESAASAL